MKQRVILAGVIVGVVGLGAVAAFLSASQPVAPGSLVAVLPDQDGLGWPLFSPDGLSILTVDHDLRATVWDSRSGLPKAYFTLGSRPGLSAFSRDGTVLWTSDRESPTRLCSYNVKTGARFELGQAPKDLEGKEWKACAISGTGTLLLSGFGDTRIGLYDPALGGFSGILDSETGRRVKGYPEKLMYFFEGCGFSEDGRRCWYEFLTVAIRGETYERVPGIVVWDTSTGKVLFEKWDSASKTRNFALSPDARFFYASTPDGSIQAAELDTGKTRIIAPVQPGDEYLFLMAAGDVLVAYGSPREYETGMIRILDARNGNHVRSLPYRQFDWEGIGNFELSASGDYLLFRSSRDEWLLIDLKSGRTRDYFPRPGRYPIALAPVGGETIWDDDGDNVLVGADGYTLIRTLVEPAGDVDQLEFRRANPALVGKSIETRSGERGPVFFGFALDGSFLKVAIPWVTSVVPDGSGFIERRVPANTLAFFDPFSGMRRSPLPLPPIDDVTGHLVSEDGSVLAIYGANFGDWRVCVYRMPSGDLVRTIDAWKSVMSLKLVFSGDGRLLALSGEKTIRIVGIEDGREIGAFARRGDFLLLGGKPRPDGAVVVSEDADGAVRLLKPDGQPTLELPPGRGERFVILRLSPDGRGILLQAGADLAYYDLDSGNQTWRIPGSFYIGVHALSANGTRLFLLRNERTALSMDTKDGTLRATACFGSDGWCVWTPSGTWGGAGALLDRTLYVRVGDSLVPASSALATTRDDRGVLRMFFGE
jgi:WD40 repeat protein